MATPTIDELQQRFGSERVRMETGRGGLIAVRVVNAAAEGEVYLHGAHVTGWQPKGAQPVLFVSEKSHFAAGKPIRGGIPVCWPWFAGHASDASKPSHGFARHSPWTLAGIDDAPDATSVRLTLTSDDATRALWPHDFTAELRVTFGAKLGCALKITNRGDGACTFEEALHTYFSVGDAKNVRITGLQGATYVDKTANMARVTQGPEPVVIAKETDWVYQGHSGAAALEDPTAKRTITVEKTHSRTTVVWNPWIEKAAKMADFGDDEWPGMVCIETANTGENSVNLAPGASHEMSLSINVEAL